MKYKVVANLDRFEQYRIDSIKLVYRKSLVTQLRLHEVTLRGETEPVECNVTLNLLLYHPQ